MCLMAMRSATVKNSGCQDSLRVRGALPPLGITYNYKHNCYLNLVSVCFVTESPHTI